MSATKKRTKRYVPRIPQIPGLLQVQMTREARPDLALRLHLAVINLIEAPTVPACNQLSMQLTCIAGGMSHASKGQPILGRTDAASIAIKSAIMTIESIVDRHDRTGALVVKDEDAMSLRAAVGNLDAVLGQIPLPYYTRAVKEVEAFTGVRV
ncbi:hypothetical protein [Noviherbaspirillum malthae]|uniref:hypothetical protein n=1 Tax=Noviherbaspirillum malthae TaxID=1260987 RepID=UPI00188F0A73|nr:hypothetical protein [Noviherbaspirillum malthae]